MNNREYLKSFLERNNISKEELALIFGINKSTVGHWLTGVRNMPELVRRVLLFFDDYGLDIKTFYEE